MKSVEARDAVVPVHEELLDRDVSWALSEGSRHFEEKSAVQDALQRISRRLEELGIPYAVAGGMALIRHGFRRLRKTWSFSLRAMALMQSMLTSTVSAIQRQQEPSEH